MKIVIVDLNERGIFRPIDEITGKNKNNDTGLSNRLLCWELMKIVNHLNDNKFEIVIDTHQNPETNNCFTLEDTTVKEVGSIDYDKYLPITDSMIQDIVDGKLKLEDKNYYTDFTKRQICDFFDGKYPTRFIRGLKFVHDDINEQVQNSVRGCIGIHVRRGRGVRIHNDKSTIDLTKSFDLESGKFSNEQIGKVKVKSKNSIDLDLFSGWHHKSISKYLAMKFLLVP